MSKNSSLDAGNAQERILEAAIEVLAQRGYTGAGVQEIVELSGTSKGSFYFHFPSKEKMVMALVDRMSVKLIKKAVLPWLGGDVSFALLDPTTVPRPEWVMLVQTRDRNASRQFLGKLARYLENQRSMRFANDTYRGAFLYKEEEDQIGFAATGGYVVIGSSQKAVQDMVRNLADPPAWPLAQEERFIRTTDQLPADRFMLAYANSGNLYRDLEGDIGQSSRQAYQEMGHNIPDVVALSGSFIEGGVRLDLYGDTPRGALVLGEGHLNTIRALPRETLLMVSLSGVQDVWRQFRRILEGADPNAAQRLEEGLEALKDIARIDLEGRVISELSGEFTMALLPGPFRLDQYGDPTNAIRALVLAEAEESRELKRTLDKIMVVAEMGTGGKINYQDVDGNEIVTLDLQKLGGLFRHYSPGYLLTEDLLAIGTTVDVALEVASVLEDATKSLSTADNFSFLVDTAPEETALLVFANIDGMASMVVDALPPKLRSDYDRDVSPWVQPLDTFFAALAITRETTRMTVVLTLKE